MLDCFHRPCASIARKIENKEYCEYWIDYHQTIENEVNFALYESLIPNISDSWIARKSRDQKLLLFCLLIN